MRKSLSESIKGYEVNEASNNWKTGIVFGNSLTKANAQSIIKNMRLDADGAYPNIEVKFTLDKVKKRDDTYGIKVVAGYKDSYDKSEYSRFKKDLSAMLKSEITSYNESLNEGEINVKLLSKVEDDIRKAFDKAIRDVQKANAPRKFYTLLDKGRRGKELSDYTTEVDKLLHPQLHK